MSQAQHNKGLYVTSSTCVRVAYGNLSFGPTDVRVVTMPMPQVAMCYCYIPEEKTERRSVDVGFVT